jgi:indolepyruvate ferredoxin oxidoreductase beta subunit
MQRERLRIYLTGVGGQGTLTATALLARTVLDQGLEVVSGEVHGMAQRGGVVESSVLIGGWRSPGIYHGEADVILGFELLEALRALPYLAPGGAVLAAAECVPPPAVNMGLAALPARDDIMRRVSESAAMSRFIPISDLGGRAGAVQSGNTALLGALCASGLLPFGVEALKQSVRRYLPARVVESNLRAADLGAAALAPR